MNSKAFTRGWVYVITNPGFKDLVKIGFTLKDPRLRAKELQSTGVPYKYEVEYEMFCENPEKIERSAHRELAKYREGKEWFRCDREKAVKTIRLIVGSDIVYESSGWNSFNALGSGANEESYPEFWHRYVTPGEKLRYVSERLHDQFSEDGLVFSTIENLRLGLQLLAIWRSYNPDSTYWETGCQTTLFEIAKLGITNRDVEISDDSEVPTDLHKLRSAMIINLIYGDSPDFMNAQELIDIARKYSPDEDTLQNLVCYEAYIFCKMEMFVEAKRHLATYLRKIRATSDAQSYAYTIEEINNNYDFPAEVTDGL